MATKGTILVTGANGGLGSAHSGINRFEGRAILLPRTDSTPSSDTEHAPTLTSALAHGTAHAYDIVALDLTRPDDVRNVEKETNMGPPCLTSIVMVSMLVKVA